MKKIGVLLVLWMGLSLTTFFVLDAQEETGKIEERITKTDEPVEEDSLESDSIVSERKKKEAEEKEIEETKYYARKIEYHIEENLIVLTDSAMAQYKSISVFAETIEYNVETKVVRAYGHPILIEKEDTIVGTMMVYNIETQRGMVNVGRTKMEKGFFTGDTILKVGEKTLNVLDGNFTTCENEPPHYTFYAKRMKVYANDMVICEPVILNIKGIPVFAVPFWFFPIKKGRHSGFLFPKVGKGSTEGRYVRNLTYFWATNDYSDLTFTFDIFEKKGIKSFVNGRYIVTPFLSGEISGSYINDVSVKSKRWNFYMNHQQNLGNRLSLNAHANFVSDADYNVDYSEEEVVQLNKEIESYLSVSKSWSGANLSILLNERRDLSKNTIDRRIPRIGFSLSSRRIIPVKEGGTPRIYNQPLVSFSSRFINKTHKDDDTTYTNYGLANNMKFQSPMKVLSYFTVSPSLTVWENVYDEDVYGNRYPIRSYYSTSLAFNTVIYGISKGGLWRFEKFRHVIKPSISYNYSPEEKDPQRYYSLEGMGVGSAQKNVAFSLSNLIQTKGEFGGKERKINLLTVNTSASYNFKLEEEPLSNIRNSIEIEPIREFSTRIELQHNPYDWELKNFTVRTNLRLQGKLATGERGEEGITGGSRIWRMNLTHNYVKGIGDQIDSQQLFGGIDTWITKNWKIGYKTRYDFKEKSLISQTLSIYRNIHCWQAQFSWNSYGGRWKYDFKIEIKKIPEIKVTKGVFGIFIP
jgi:lipopolysaccharide assembly outer membrane protein LptD (OstA)